MRRRETPSVRRASRCRASVPRVPRRAPRSSRGARLARVAATGESLDRLERAGSQFHARVREEYLRIAAQFPERFIVVDAAAPIEKVFEDVVDSLLRSLER